MATQFGAVTRRIRKPRYREIIETEAARLPEIYRQRDEKAHQEGLYQIEQDRLGLEKSQLRHEKDMAKEARREAERRFKRQEKQAKRAQIVQGVNLAANVLGATKQGQDWGMEPVVSGAKKLWSGRDGSGGLWGGVKSVFSGLFG
jgi:hypothetical protein